MRNILIVITLLVATTGLVSCSGGATSTSPGGKDEVAAVVNGTKITVADGTPPPPLNIEIPKQ